MNQLAMILAPFIILASCNRTKEAEQPMAAQTTAEEVRTGWDRSVKPIAISIEDCPDGLLEIGVKATVKDAMPEEQTAFESAVFKKDGDKFLVVNPHVVTLDTAAVVAVCVPPRTGSELSLSAPFTENLYGTEISRSIKLMVYNENGDTIVDDRYAFNAKFRLASSVAALQIVTESDDVRDVLERLRIIGDGLATSGTYKPYSGEWSDVAHGGYVEANTANCLMSNGREHNIYLVPMPEATPIQVFATINDKEMSVKTTLPPMAAGSLTRLNLHKDGSTLKISGSWVATKRPLAFSNFHQVDTVKPGNYLRSDGYVVGEKDAKCVAMVIETDGKHGKPVALADSEGEYKWLNTTSGIIFPTIDGKRNEGKINPGSAENIPADNRIVFTPKVNYAPTSALGYPDGAELTSKLMGGFTRPDDACMLMEVQRHPGSYVPSVAELAQLYYYFNPLKGRYDWTESLTAPEGQYLTSSESSATTVYLFDFGQGIITGSSSKQYTKARLRLFYLF